MTGIPQLRDVTWRRLDARMLLVHPVQEAVRFLPALLVLFVTGRTNERSPWWDVAAVVAVVLLGVSRWFTTRYRIHHGQIELQRGLLKREVIATPAERVRTVDVTAPVWHRALGLAKVEIGTAGGQGVERLVLDALSAAEAARLRGELLHRQVRPATAPSQPPPAGASGAGTGFPGAGVAGAGPAGTGVPGAEAGDAVAAAEPVSQRGAAEPVSQRGAAEPVSQRDPETLLLRLDPAWVRYAPLTTSGMVSAAALLGFASQFVGDIAQGRQEQIGGAITWAQSLGLWLLLLLALVTGLAFVSALAVTGYVLSYWGFRLTRHTGGTLHVRRGLLTTRSTSIEEARMRGVEVGEPLGLRLAGGSRLFAITTGLRRRESGPGSAWLSPPAARAAVLAVAAAVVGDPVAVTGRLVEHGPRARRRRYVRAVGGTLLVAGLPAALAEWAHWPGAVVAVLVLVCIASPILARDRYAGLGHLVTDRHLVTRSGSFSRRRDVLARHGVIGVVVRESFFQRRAGVATVTATTAAGKQGYHVIDVPAYRAVELSHELLPDTVGQFLA
ncbi:MAG: PH domain-containing protein [Dermatophilaceae bacterium]